MTRVILLACIAMLAACASGPPDLPPGSGFPRAANVDPRLNLTGSDRVQIAKLVAAETTEPIQMVWRAGNPNRILVTRAKGPGFMMERIGRTWKITGTITITSSQSGPGVEPIEVGSGVRTY